MGTQRIKEANMNPYTTIIGLLLLSCGELMIMPVRQFQHDRYHQSFDYDFHRKMLDSFKS